ncbi:ubiquitin-like modifier-activating enzyme 1 [Crassostrea angulata]|uniref:ubiquitin-like modifier-activating enzyme 1 n=1 Tax=Magallana angulata TaxID=2784310 RepID=UPI0022B183DB|nr:ubiquitin-like modifier-activating enzyme 1 [Crassostrea angulata]
MSWMTLTHAAMKQMANSAILINGIGGLGIEIGTNLTIQDCKLAEIQNLGTQFFLREEDVGKNRAKTSCSRLAELNSYVSLSALKTGLDCDSDLSYLAGYQTIKIYGLQTVYKLG